MVPVILQPAKVAVPLVPLALTGLVVQLKVPTGSVKVIELVAEVPTLPLESSTATTGWVGQAAALAQPAGAVLKASWVAAPKVRVTLEVALVRPEAAAVKV